MVAGLAAPIVIGAAIGGSVAVASLAISDIANGEVSSVDEYITTAFEESFIGAMSGAIFGPFTNVNNLKGILTLGGATGAFESCLRQLLNTGTISLGQVAKDTALGVLFAGVFHGLGKLGNKVFEKLKSSLSGRSSAFKNALNQIGSKVDDGFNSIARYLDDMWNRLNPEEVVADSLGGIHRIPGDESPFSDFVSKITGNGSKTSYVKLYFQNLYNYFRLGIYLEIII